MNQRDKLNAALMDAHAKGLRVFACFGCGDWFIQQSGPGRDRRTCNDPWCLRLFRYWKRYGRLPSYEGSALLKPNKADLKHRPVKLLFECEAA